MAEDYDSPWKEALDLYFEPFLALLYPQVHSQIDWSRGWEALDKEFQQVVREAELGRRYVDKLAKVWTSAGAECWVLIHVEVQTDREAGFPLRMYVYHYRIFNRYNRPVRDLYERGFDAKNVRELFRLIDWLMVLPPPLETMFRRDAERIQKEKQMPYVTSIERVAIREALRKGIRSLLKVRFGDEGLKLMPEIENVYEIERLETILNSLETASSPEELRAIWSPPAEK